MTDPVVRSKNIEGLSQGKEGHAEAGSYRPPAITALPIVRNDWSAEHGLAEA